VVAVGHRQFEELGADGGRHLRQSGRHVLLDLKGLFPREATDWRL